jgi:hypothetical protein
MRQIGGYRRSLQETVGQINQAIGNVRDKAAELIERIDQDTLFARENAKQMLMNALSEIGGKKGQLRADAAFERQRALQDYQQLVTQINARNTAFKQDLYQRAQSTQDRLAQMQQQAMQNFEAVFTPYGAPEINISGEGTPEQVGQQLRDLQGYYTSLGQGDEEEQMPQSAEAVLGL